jgi:diguanylate cyclase (GGDEF)-like protein
MPMFALMGVARFGAYVRKSERDFPLGRWATVIVRALALGAGYAAIYRLIVLEGSFGTSVGSTFWPASGVTVSVLLLRPRREWLFYLLAIGIADFTMDIHSGGYSARASIGIALANCAEPLLSASLLRRWLRTPPDLSRLRDLGLFYAAAAGAGPLLSATVASVWQWALGADAVWPYLGRWYVGDALGVVVIAPVILTAVWSMARVARAGTLARLIDGARTIGWPIAVLFVVAAVALPWRFAARDGLPFLVIPTLSLIAIRGGTRAAAVAVFIVGVLVEIVTAMGAGPFAGAGAFTGLLSAQMYMAACSASGLTAAALMAGLLSRDQLARHDTLTGLPNRRLLGERMSDACGRLAHHPGTVGLVYIDLDDFKAINDAYGHAVGDHVLVETARRLASVVRDGDTVARIGGDEFVILVRSVTDGVLLPSLVERVDRALRQPIEYRGERIAIRGSIGCTVTDRPHENGESVLARADQDMYGTKRARGEVGRG